ASLRNRLSCQTTRVRKPEGSRCAAAARSTMRQIRCRIVAAVSRSCCAQTAAGQPPRSTANTTAAARRGCRKQPVAALLQTGCRIWRRTVGPCKARQDRGSGRRDQPFLQLPPESAELEVAGVEVGERHPGNEDRLGRIERDQGAVRRGGGVGLRLREAAAN